MRLRRGLGVGDLVGPLVERAALVVEPLLALGEPVLAPLDVLALLVEVGVQDLLAAGRPPQQQQHAEDRRADDDQDHDGHEHHPGGDERGWAGGGEQGGGLSGMMRHGRLLSPHADTQDSDAAACTSGPAPFASRPTGPCALRLAPGLVVSVMPRGTIPKTWSAPSSGVLPRLGRGAGPVKKRRRPPAADRPLTAVPTGASRLTRVEGVVHPVHPAGPVEPVRPVEPLWTP